jgi:hypothetical protein
MCRVQQLRQVPMSHHDGCAGVLDLLASDKALSGLQGRAVYGSGESELVMVSDSQFTRVRC